MSPLTISITLVGYYLTATKPELNDSLLLTGVGICAHYFGFGLNDIVDRQIDQHSFSRQHSPLVAKTLPLWFAYIIVIIQVPLAIFLYNLTQPSVSGLFILIFSVIASIVYNLWSKTGLVPRFFAEVALAASIGALLLSASLVNHFPFNPISLTASIAVMLILLDLNSISSGLKDLANDLKAGASSFVISLGASINESGLIHLPRALITYTLIIHITVFITLILLGIILKSPISSWIAAGLSYFYSSMHLQLILKQASYANLQQSAPILGGYYLYFAFLAFMYPLVPLIIKAFIVTLGIFLISFPFRIMFRVAKKGYIFLNK